MNDQGLSRRRFLLAAGGAVAIAACGVDSNDVDPSDAGTERPPGRGGTLRYHSLDLPDTLDPARGQVQWGGSLALGYDVLIYQAPDGSYQPQLARSWRYIGEGNTTFEITLRAEIKFNDGEPVNAEAVKANIEYRRDPSVASQSALYLAAVTEVELVDDLTVRVHLSEPNPEMPNLFSQGQQGPGILISPAAIAKPEMLATDNFGVGRYKLDKGETVLGDHFTYVANPEYWNQDAIYWDKVVVKYLPEESAALSSLQAGQLDAAVGSFAIVESAKQSGLAVTGPGYPIVLGISLFDREGTVVPALGDVRVRQALNYAVDREKIVSALVGESGSPIDQLSAPGHAGWNDGGFYPYDIDRAKDLLKEAGYADGFSVPVRIPNSEANVRLAEAVADDLRQIGVKLDLDPVPGPQFDQADATTNRDYGAVFLGWGIDTPVRMGTSFWLPNATNNAFGSKDDTLVDLHQQALVADEETKSGLDREIVARVAELAWFIPVLINGQSVLFDDDVVTVPWEDFVSVPTVIEIQATS